MYCCSRRARVNIPNQVFSFSSAVFHERRIRIVNQPSLISTNNATFYACAKYYFQISFTLRLLLVECCWCGGPCDYCCTLANRKCKVKNDVILFIHRKSSIFRRRGGSGPESAALHVHGHKLCKPRVLLVNFLGIHYTFTTGTSHSQPKLRNTFKQEEIAVWICVLIFLWLRLDTKELRSPLKFPSVIIKICRSSVSKYFSPRCMLLCRMWGSLRGGYEEKSGSDFCLLHVWLFHQSWRWRRHIPT